MQNRDRPEAFVVSGARHRTHAEIRHRAARAASGFAAMGIGADDAVALLMRNDFAMFEAALAARQVGAFTVPLNWHAASDDVAYILRDCGARALVAHDDLLAALDPEVLRDLSVLVVETPTEIRAAFSTGDGAPSRPNDASKWDDWLGGFAPLADSADGPSTPVVYTSGTTGRPKGVRRTGSRKPGASTKALKVYGLDRPGPIKVLVTGPMYHSVPNAYARLALEVGADIVLEPRFDPEDLLAHVARNAITHMHVVPAMFLRLLRLPEAVRRRYDLGSLRHVVHGAAPCPREVKRAMIDWWGPVIHEYYGSTETGLLTLIGPEEAAARPDSVGRALPGITLHILDADGSPLPNGESGDIYAGSETAHAFTYLGQERKRRDVGRGDLVTAGDVGWLDANGYLFLRDRKRDLISTGGRQIAPALLEAALLRLDVVRDCAVFGVGGRDGSPDETICACVEPVEDASPDPNALRDAILSAAGLVDPALEVAIVTSLPREDSGKIFKSRLKAQFVRNAG